MKQARKALEEDLRKDNRKELRQDEQLAQLEAQLLTAEGRYMQNMLIDQIRYLRGMLQGADQRPGQDAFRRFETLRREFNDLVTRWRDLKGNETEFRQLD